ncbi:MOSC domain-containing protein [Paenibacillus wulumuqiensis]|uniref:MOSC domain-containing protein n=1 Tax=Paenibacillus wulumuqiensis TaxID=1567107 RepID=UPI0006197346|nr:MOSC domain-containing protein [Paenibacillus wulumuqiensis]
MSEPEQPIQPITVESVLIADTKGSFLTRQVPEIQIELAGIPGDRHYGLLRRADARQKIYKRGTMIANRRQISIVSYEECLEIAQRMGLPEIRPEWLGANLIIRGLEQLTLLPAGARLLFPDGTGLICEGENVPCRKPAKMIESLLEQPGLASKFMPAAKKRRGIVCSVEREGLIRQDDTIQIVTAHL